MRIFYEEYDLDLSTVCINPAVFLLSAYYNFEKTYSQTSFIIISLILNLQSQRKWIESLSFLFLSCFTLVFLLHCMLCVSL